MKYVYYEDEGNSFYSGIETCTVDDIRESILIHLVKNIHIEITGLSVKYFLEGFYSRDIIDISCFPKETVSIYNRNNELIN